MTTLLILFASLAGAALFFVAGYSLMALRQRDILAAAEQTVRSQATFIEDHQRLFETEAPTTVMRDVNLAHEAAALRVEADRLRSELDQATKDASAASALRSELEQVRKEASAATALRRDLEQARKDASAAAALRRELEQAKEDATAATDLRRELERIRKEAAVTTSTVQELRRTAEERAQQLDRARTDSAALNTELAQLQSKLRDVERQLADKTAASRDLSTENEKLKGRLRDADALRAEYVRLRTATTDSEFLKSEIARLEKELHESRVDALGAQKPKAASRAARGTDRQVTKVQRTIGESLARVIEKFADAGTRSSAIADRQGFPLASSGTDGIALAAYAAHLFESASRAKDYLPVGAPGSIEIVDTSGVRITLWSFEVEADRLMLANLAVSPVDSSRVETTLGDLAQILAPSAAKVTAAP